MRRKCDCSMSFPRGRLAKPNPPGKLAFSSRTFSLDNRARRHAMRQRIGLVLLFTIACGITAGCGSNTSGTGGGGAIVKLQGAGASFPAPLYVKWFKDFKAG